METPKSKALAMMIKELMSKFVSKDLEDEQKEEDIAEMPDELVKEEAESEELDHPEMGEGEAQDVAKQHLMKRLGEGDKDEYGKPDMQEDDDKKPSISMSFLAGKKKLAKKGK